MTNLIAFTIWMLLIYHRLPHVWNVAMGMDCESTWGISFNICTHCMLFFKAKVHFDKKGINRDILVNNRQLVSLTRKHLGTRVSG